MKPRRAVPRFCASAGVLAMHAHRQRLRALMAAIWRRRTAAKSTPEAALARRLVPGVQLPFAQAACIVSLGQLCAPLPNLVSSLGLPRLFPERSQFSLHCARGLDIADAWCVLSRKHAIAGSDALAVPAYVSDAAAREAAQLKIVRT